MPCPRGPGVPNLFVEHWFGDCLYGYAGCKQVVVRSNHRILRDQAACRVTDYIGFVAGLASIGCWLVAQLPQLLENARTQNVEALSPWFLGEWLMVRQSSGGAQQHGSRLALRSHAPCAGGHMQPHRLPADGQPAPHSAVLCNVRAAAAALPIRLTCRSDTGACVGRYFITIDVVLVVQYIYYGSLSRRRARRSSSRRASRERVGPLSNSRPRWAGKPWHPSACLFAGQSGG